MGGAGTNTPTGIQSIRENRYDISEGNVKDHMEILREGFNPAVASTCESYWSFGGRQVFPTAAVTVDLVSTSVNDTLLGTGGRVVLVEGLAADYSLLSEFVLMNGLTPVTTVNSYLRIQRTTVVSVGSLMYNEGDISTVETVSGNAQSNIRATENSSFNANWTVPLGFAWLVSDFTSFVEEGRTAEGSIFLEHPTITGGQTLKVANQLVSSTAILPRTLPVLFQEKTTLSACAVLTQGSSSRIAGSLIGYIKPQDEINLAGNDRSFVA